LSVKNNSAVQPEGTVVGRRVFHAAFIVVNFQDAFTAFLIYCAASMGGVSERIT